jgi:hypothetical protein
LLLLLSKFDFLGKKMNIARLRLPIETITGREKIMNTGRLRLLIETITGRLRLLIETITGRLRLLREMITEQDITAHIDQKSDSY